MLSPPENGIAVVKSLTEADTVTGVKLLGDPACAFDQAFGGLTVRLPDQLPTSYTNVLGIKLA